MSIIRQHRIIYYTATVFLLPNFVLFSFQRAGYALSYWDAIFEIGFNPETQEIDSTNACKQIERLVRFRNAVHELPVFDENLNDKIREVESRISSLDAGNLYNQLHYSINNGVWRSIGIRGGLEDDHYQLSLVNPAIENWVNFSSKCIPELWGPQEQFGDFGLRAFIRPVTNGTFRLATEGHTYIDDLNSANMIRIIQRLVEVMWMLAKDGDHPSTEFFEDSDLDDQSLKVIFGLAKDFPNLFTIFDRYFTIENVVSREPNGSSGPKTFDIAIRINVSAIKKHYPHLGMLIDRLNGMLNFQSIVFDAQNRPLCTIAFDSDKYLFSMRFRTQQGRFLSIDENPANVKEAGVGLTDPGNQNFHMTHTFRLKFVGLKLNIEALKINFYYFFDDSGANVRAELRQPPEEITAEGLIMGVLPIWLIDFLIPSNIEDMTREFFQTLASGNNGEGVSILFGSIPEKPLKDNLWLLTDAEVPSNITMRFAFNLQRNMVREEDKLLEDIKVFEQQLWKAFYLDFLRIKVPKFCRQ